MCISFRALMYLFLFNYYYIASIFQMRKLRQVTKHAAEEGSDAWSSVPTIISLHAQPIPWYF